MNDSLRDFDEAGHGVDLDEPIGLIESFSELLNDSHIGRLWTIIQGRVNDEVEYGPDFDIGDEVRMQIVAVRAMRRSVMTDGGVVRVGVPARELKEVVTASNTLLQTLMKTHDKIMSYDRQRAIEEAVVETMHSLPDDKRIQFMEQLETNLSQIE
jgi:hypothetical protein